ncbi:hypothetical protein Tco_0876105 [Tanacetum coccineum]|uniref:Uncharacterized protein n=1 Tax=Tanacetum coccineum TaxID=301880 RepID=A0ABQ5BWC5_9ASTR
MLFTYLLPNTNCSGMFKLDLEPLPPRLLQNREVHITYLRNTQEQANILQELVKQAKAKQPLDGDLDLACRVLASDNIYFRFERSLQSYSPDCDACPLSFSARCKCSYDVNVPAPSDSIQLTPGT